MDRRHFIAKLAAFGIVPAALIEEADAAGLHGLTDVSSLDDLAARINTNKYPTIAAYAKAQAVATQSEELDIQQLLADVDMLKRSVSPPPDGGVDPGGGTSGPPPTGTPLFDGRAIRMTSLTGSTLPAGTGSNASQDPQIFGENPGTPSGLYFMRRNNIDDAEVVADTTWTKVYRFGIGQGSTNPYLTLYTDGRASAELTRARPVTAGQVDWYADAYKIVSPYHMPTSGPFNVMSQYGYPSIYSPPLSVNFDNNGLGIDRHVGLYSGGNIQYALKPRFYTLAQVLDKWLEIVVGVQWQFDTAGWIYVYGRIEGEAGPTLKYSDLTHPTNQYTGSSFPTSVNDKHGLYMGRFAVGAIQENVVYHRGFVRWATQADAFASMGWAL